MVTMGPKKASGIRQSEPPKTPKVWEKARREKMRIYFNELQEVLPLYDPSAPMSRFEILQKSRTYIKELQSQNQDLLNGGFDDVYKGKMEKLKLRVKELLQRVDQLTDLLRRANIMIPPLIPCTDKKENLSLSQKWMNQRPKKWTEKINVIVPDEKIENILTLIKDFKKKNKIHSSKKNGKVYEKESDKEQNSCLMKKGTFSERLKMKKKKQLNIIKTSEVSKVTDMNSNKLEDKSNSDTFTASQSPSHMKENQPVDFNLIHRDEPDAKTSETNNEAIRNEDDSGSSEKVTVDNKLNSKTASSEKISVVTGRMKNVLEPQNNVFLPASPNVMQSNTYLLTNDGNLVQFPILNSSGNVFAANSNLLTQATIVNQSNTGLLTPLVINRPSPLIVLQKPGPQIIQAAQIVNQTPQILSVPNQNIQILGNSIVCATPSQNNSSKTLPYILSKQPANKKRIAKDSTVTTYVNKIPIPALSKQSYVKKAVGLSNGVGTKAKNQPLKGKDSKEKFTESAKAAANECEREVQVNEKEIQTEKFSEEPASCSREAQKTRQEEEEPKDDESSSQKRGLDNGNPKKQKISEDDSDANVFKPIENPILSDSQIPNDGLFCNLKLPNSVSHNLSVSPTAAFLSTFPIVASSKFEVDEDLTGKIDERRQCEEKEGKPNGEKSNKDKDIGPEMAQVSTSKTCDLTTPNSIMAVKEPPQPPVSLSEDKVCEVDNRQLLKPNCNAEVPSASVDANTTSNDIVNGVAKDNYKNGNISRTPSNTGIVISNISNDVVASGSQCPQLLNPNKSWDNYQQQKNCDVRADPFYINSDVHIPAIPLAIPDISNSMATFPEAIANVNSAIYKSPYPQNNMKTNFNDQGGLTEQIASKSNQFDYGQKENFLAKRMSYGGDRNVAKKPCPNPVNETYNIAKNQPAMYQSEITPNYQLIPMKEMPNQRNSRPPVNWMTDPDVRTRTMSYETHPDKMSTAKIPPFTQPDIFYMNNQNAKPQTEVSTDYILADGNKNNYQKNNFYVNKTVETQMKMPDQRYKDVEKRPETKFPPKPAHNSYNIFDYNYNGNYFGDDESNKFCSIQNYSANAVKPKKNSVPLAKKKSDNSVHLINGDQQTNDATKRNSDQIISNADFNPVGNQECFSWIPGKNVDWLPSKSFVDTNLILPSTLPTLVGDLALGTTTSNDIAQTKGNNRIKQKTGVEGKSYTDLGLGNNAAFAKTVEPETNKQYLEPFTNLSKNIFDVTPTNNMQTPQLSKNDFDKNSYLGNANETIVLKNIFELPVSKSFGSDYFANRNKQRPLNNSQNTFLSVSQLVETPNYDSSIKGDTSMDNKQPETYSQNYAVCHSNQKMYKGKNRNSHYKYNDRKYHGYKNASSNYTAEALIRSNTNLTYQNGEFQSELNSNLYSGKTPQKTDNYSATGKNDFEKTDFVPCSTQNIYADFNFSSPVSNFNFSTTVGSDYVTHDANFTSQNNFFGDFIPPEYPITESVSNSLLLPPCSIGLQNPFIIEKRNGTPEKMGKGQGKQYPNSRSRKNFDCSKTNYSDFSIGHNTSTFTTANICPTIFTTTSCQNLLPVPNQNDPNITFPASSFGTSNIPFPPLTSTANVNYHRPTGGAHNATTAPSFPSGCPSMFTTCSTTTVSSSRTCPSTIPPTSSSNAVITTSFSVGGASLPSSTQSTLPFLSLSNPIIPPSVPTTSGNSLANFNLSTIFPEINQKGNYHYP